MSASQKGGRSVSSRSAEYSIQGYLYQFLKYLQELLAADNGECVTIEGPIEDIDVTQGRNIRAIQCKYHAQQDRFSLSKIYKPILLMLEHFCANKNSGIEVSYNLFCYFQGSPSPLQLTLNDLKSVVATTSVSLKPILERIGPSPDLQGFLGNITVQFGPDIAALEETVIAEFIRKGLNEDDVRAIFYPAAIQRIFDTGTKALSTDRTLRLESFLKDIKNIKKVSLNRWTNELKTRKEILKRMRSNLKNSLNLNSRRRVFVIFPGNISNFEDNVLIFIKKFLERYSCKSLHDDPPIFIFPPNFETAEIEVKLHDRGFPSTNGLVAGKEFRSSYLMREPMIKRRPVEMEFKFRISELSKIGNLNSIAKDEVFLVNCASSLTGAIQAEVFNFELDQFDDLEYVLQLRGVV